MITAEELVGAITVDDGGSNITKLATVTELFTSGKPKLKFDGEELPSEKEYEGLGSYSPSVGDRVLLLGASGTWVILGKLGIVASIDELEAIRVELNRKISSNINVDNGGNHNIDYMYVDPSNLKLIVRRKNGVFTSYNPVV